MNALDCVCIILCGAFLALGAYQGLVRSVSSLAALVAGLYSAKKIEPVLSQAFTAIHAPNPRGVAGYLIAFFFVFLSMKVLFFMAQKLLRASGISVVDRVFGGLLGLAKGVVIAVFACTILQLALPRDSAILRDSELLPYANRIVSSARMFLPDGVHRYIKA